MGDESDTSDSTNSARGSGVDALRRLVNLADAIIVSVRFVTIACLAAGAWFWVVAFAPFRFSVATGLLALTALIVAMLPGIIMALFYLGLQEVRKAPERVSELRRQGAAGARDVAAALRRDSQAPDRGHRWRLLRALWEVRSLADEARGLAFQYFAIVRLANPITAGAVAVSIAASAALAVIAAIVTVIRMV